MSKTYECPQCGEDALARESAGVWECRSCGNTVAGGAYEPDTGAETKLRRALSDQREELEEAKDELEV